MREWGTMFIKCNYVKSYFINILKNISNPIYMKESIEGALITAGIGTLVGIVWKTINHYKLKSSCNKNNELVVSVVNTDTNKNASANELNQVALEIKEAITTGNA
jgi:hypothetical protein